MRNFCFTILYFFVFSSTGIAQNDTAPSRIYTTQRIPSDVSIEIDGILDDAAWDQVEWASDFIENEPNENTEPHQQTRFKVLYDEKFIYFGVQSLDKSPDSIVSWLSRRDGFDGDRINVFIDSYFDKRTAFMFGVTAAGVKGDAIVSQNGEEFDDSWNPVWYTDTHIDAEGWTAEMKIPLSQLRFGKSKEQIWGLNIARNIFRVNERSLWDRIPAGAAGSVSEYGELHGLIDLVPQKQLEIQPFTVLKYETYPEEENNPFRDGQDSGINAGLDAKIGVTNDLTLDLTVNPDFGQVEADPAAIALDGFQIFFREQRPFFVENKNIFEFELNGQDNLFYSRRIGRNPQGFVVREDGEFVDIPDNTTILGAAKFSGKTRDGWSIGILESLTAKEFAEIDRNGDRREELIEPLTNYFVGRLQKDLNDRNSFIGGMFTATNRDNKEELQYLRTSAYSGGMDFLHQWKNREYFVRGKTILSHVEGSPEAIENTQRELTHLFQRIDADHVEVDPTRTSLTGTGGSFEGGRQGGGNITYSLEMSWSSPELEINDIGFLRRTDNIRQEFEINYRILQPVGELRSFRIGLEQSSAFDFEGNYNRIEYQMRGRVENLQNWSLSFGGAHKPRIYSTTELRGGPRFRFSEENYVYAFMGTNSQQKLTARGGFVYSQAKQDNFSFRRFELGVTYQPTNALRISLDPEYRFNETQTQYVTETNFNGTPRFLMGSLDNKTLSASIRVNYTINPNLSLQYYGQPFISKGIYSELKYVTNSTAENLYDRFEIYSDEQISFDDDNNRYSIDEDLDGNIDYQIGNPNFSFVQFRSNLVLRWEYVPGSEVFLVWSQGVTGRADPQSSLFEGLDNQILQQQPDNIFLIKATYRFIL